MKKINKINHIKKTSKLNKYMASGSKAQASIEFILVIPILIIVILIVSQLGHYVYLQNVLEQAAREGARIISTTNSDNDARNQISGICKTLEKDKINIEIQPDNRHERKVGDNVRVTISYQHGGIANIFNFLTGNDYLIKSSSTMRMECNT